jgi:nitrogenase-stabilizing/protective protein
MNAGMLESLGALSSAEDFFAYLDVPFDAAVVHVNRLHILKRFNQYLRGMNPRMEALPPAEQREAYRSLLLRAYGDFIRSTPANEKVFKVFQAAEGAQVGLESLRGTLPSRTVSPTDTRTGSRPVSPSAAGAVS